MTGDNAPLLGIDNFPKGVRDKVAHILLAFNYMVEIVTLERAQS